MNGMSNAMEGWRAVLTVVLRYGMVQKQRIEYGFLAPKDSAETGGQDSEAMDVDNVKAMITGVKTRGVGFRVFYSSASLTVTVGQGPSQICQGPSWLTVALSV